MTQQLINIGTFPNDATGDPARTAFTKINNNFTQVFSPTFFNPPSMIIGPPTPGTAPLVINTVNGSGLGIIMNGTINNPLGIGFDNFDHVGSQASVILDLGDGTNFGFILWQNAGFTPSNLAGGVTGLALCISTNTSSAPISIGAAATEAMRFVPGGNIIINPPTSGLALNVQGQTTIGGVAVTGGLTLSIANTSAVDGDTARVQTNANGIACAIFSGNAATSTPIITGGPTGAQGILRVLGTNAPLVFGTNNTYRGQFLFGGGFVVVGAIGCNGITAPPAQNTGWGTPTGPAVVANFSGSAATLVQTSTAVAQIITVLKAIGFLGA